MRRLAEQEAEHDRILAGLKPCRAYNDDGSACSRKANPGLSFCHLHVGYNGPLQPPAEEPVAPVAASAAREPKGAASLKEAATPVRTLEPCPMAIQPIVVQSPTVEGGSSMERSLVLVTTVLAILVCLTAVGGMTLVGARLLPQRQG